jgi:hypothetical protein
MRSLSETQFWLVVAGFTLTPMLTLWIADGIGWFLRRLLWQRPELASQSESEQARDEPEPEAPLVWRRCALDCPASLPPHAHPSLATASATWPRFVQGRADAVDGLPPDASRGGAG